MRIAKGPAMKREEAKAKFVRRAEEMFDEMWEWGEGNPQPTLDEIAGKAALLRRVLMGEMPAELLLQHGDVSEAEAVCPHCGQEMKWNRRRTRTALHAEADVKVKRSHRRRRCRIGLQTGRSATVHTDWHAPLSSGRASDARTPHDSAQSNVASAASTSWLCLTHNNLGCTRKSGVRRGSEIC